MKPDMQNELPEPRARVFISCGQSKGSDEVSIASKIRDRLEELGFDPYIAVQEQTLRGLKENIFEQLSKSEYFIFIDFKREQLMQSSPTAPQVHRGSLFSHQELAIASYLDIQLLALQELGVKTDDGILRFLQANAIPFKDRHLLSSVIADEVKRRKWDPGWRNELVLDRDPTQFSHTITANSRQSCSFFHIDVRNRHRHKTATNCYVYLERAAKFEPRTDIPFKSVEFKWAGYALPNAHVPPGKSRPFDAFFILHDSPTLLQFNTFSTSSDFVPRVEGAGRYELTYLVVSDNFPVTRASLILSLGASHNQTTLTLSPGATN
jgi:hypothetical protein